MSDPLVSVILPTYQHAPFLDHAIRSVAEQTMRDWDCWVIDDGSTDGTESVAMGWARRDGRVRYLYQSHRGLAAARNAGLRLARGRYLQFLDADDLLEPGKIGRQAAILESDPGLDGVYSDTEGARAPIDETASSVESLCRQNSIPVNAYLVRSELARSIGVFDESLRAHEDWDYWLRAVLGGKRFGYCPAGPGERAVVRWHDANMSRDRARMLVSRIQVREKAAGLFPGGRLRSLNDRQLRWDRARSAHEDLKEKFSPERLAAFLARAAHVDPREWCRFVWSRAGR